MRLFRKARPTRGLALLAACAAWLLFGAAATRAQTPAPRADDAMRQAKSAAPSTAADDDVDDDEESESEPVGGAARTRPRVTDPTAVLRTARLVYVRSDSVFVDPREVEASLLKRKEFRAWGMAVTHDETDADLIIEITRKSLTRRFTFTVIDPRTMAVVTGGKTRSVLLGKKIPNKIAEKFANRVKVFRPYP